MIWMIRTPIPRSTATTGNTITIIDYGGASYAYGIEAMSDDDPVFSSPLFAHSAPAGALAASASDGLSQPAL